MWIDAPGSAKNKVNLKWVETLISDGTRFGETLSFDNRRTVEAIAMEELTAVHGQPSL